MKYRVNIEGEEREVDVTVTPGGGVLVSVDGEPVEADVRRVPGGMSLILGGRVFDVAMAGPPDALQLAAGAARATADVVSERARSRRKSGGASAEGGDELRAPMPGRVVAVLVKPGQAVEVGTPCIVVEAMKMENELLAPRAGTVASVHAEVGASVESRALLVSFE